jgi:hypothetical protein
MMGLFREIGPCLVRDDDFTTTEFNPNSWSNFANVLYIEQVMIKTLCRKILNSRLVSLLVLASRRSTMVPLVVHRHSWRQQ